MFMIIWIAKKQRKTKKNSERTIVAPEFVRLIHHEKLQSPKREGGMGNSSTKKQESFPISSPTFENILHSHQKWMKFIVGILPLVVLLPAVVTTLCMLQILHKCCKCEDVCCRWRGPRRGGPSGFSRPVVQSSSRCGQMLQTQMPQIQNMQQVQVGKE